METFVPIGTSGEAVRILIDIRMSNGFHIRYNHSGMLFAYWPLTILNLFKVINMKIGILTFHCAHNYGAMLQCYALQEYMKTQGYEVYVIDYKPAYLMNAYPKPSIRHWISKNPLRMIKRLITEPFLYKNRVRRWDGFDGFMRMKFNLFPYDPTSDYSEFDVLFLGSDQIWNPRITGGVFDKVFFGDHFKCKLVSYAASMGIIQLNEDDKQILSGYLSNFDSLSVRETSLRNSLIPLTNKNIELVCDPVFLLEKEEWEEMCVPVIHESPYVLCYNLLQSEECKQQAKIVAEKTGCDLIHISGDVLPFVSKNQYRQILTPIEFISYFRNAFFVVTSSFHGTAFSVIFQKPFYVLGMGEKSGRSTSLLNILGLSERLLQEPITEVDDSFDSLLVQERLDKYKDHSKVYLANLVINR